MESEKALELAKWLRGWVVEGVPTSVIAQRLEVFADAAREEGRRAGLREADAAMEEPLKALAVLCKVADLEDVRELMTAWREDIRALAASTPDKEGT